MSGPVKLFSGEWTSVPMGRPDTCGGALVRVTEGLKTDLERDGIVWSSKFRVENDGLKRWDCRVRCDDLVEYKRIEEPNPDGPEHPPLVREVRMGLCGRCNRLEAYVRRLIAETQKRGQQ